jgi:hypothetical protein
MAVTFFAAYNHCLGLSTCQSWKVFDHDLEKTYSEGIMSRMVPADVAAVLGHSLCFAPCETGRDALACNINACEGKAELLAGLAHLYIFGLIHVCGFS